MELNNRTWDLVENTESVRGFVKTDRYPKPLAESKFKSNYKVYGVEQPSFQTSFSVGEAVKITEELSQNFISSVRKLTQLRVR